MDSKEIEEQFNETETKVSDVRMRSSSSEIKSEEESSKSEILENEELSDAQTESSSEGQEEHSSEESEYIPSSSSSTSENSEIEETRNTQITQTIEPNINDRKDVELWRVFVLILLFSAGGYLFFKFFPIEIKSPENLWEKYYNNCCSVLYNQTRCLFSGNCSNILIKWFHVNNISQNITDYCCYWFAPYSKWRVLTEAFCESNCLLSK